MQILVLGMHRSGTSVVTGLIHRMGAYFGPEELSIGANDENPTGFFERTDTIATNNAILARYDMQWNDLHASPDAITVSSEDPINDSIAMQIAEMDQHAPWVLKDPRLCITLNAWKPFLKKPVAVIVHRDPLEIARSLEKRNAMPLYQGVALWERHLASALNDTRDMPRIFIQYADLLADAEGVTMALFESLSKLGEGLHLPETREIASLVKTDYYRSRMPETPIDEILSPSQMRLLSFATGAITQAETLILSEKGKRAFADYHAFWRYQGEAERLKLQKDTLQLQLAAKENELAAATVERDIATYNFNATKTDLDAILNSRTWRVANSLRHFILRK